MAEQVTFEDWFNQNCEGLSGEARRLMQISWNAALTNGDRHFFVDELAEALQAKPKIGTTWRALIEDVRTLRGQKDESTKD